MELTSAYASIANGGTYQKPVLYTKVVDHNGNILLSNTQKGKRVMKESTAFLLTDAMKDVITKGTGKSAKLSSSMAVAGKSELLQTVTITGSAVILLIIQLLSGWAMTRIQILLLITLIKNMGKGYE